MVDPFVIILGVFFGSIAIVGGIYFYNHEKNDPLHADCGPLWKIFMPAILIVLGIGMMLIVII